MTPPWRARESAQGSRSWTPCRDNDGEPAHIIKSISPRPAGGGECPGRRPRDLRTMVMTERNRSVVPGGSENGGGRPGAAAADLDGFLKIVDCDPNGSTVLSPGTTGATRLHQVTPLVSRVEARLTQEIYCP